MSDPSQASVDAADSLLKLAERRLAEGETEQGAVLLAALISNFPKTQSAKTAAELLRDSVPKSAD